MKKILVLAIIAFAAVQSFAVGIGLRDALIIGGMNGDVGSNIGTGDVFTFEMLFPVNESFGVHAGVGLEYVDYVASEGNLDDHMMYFDIAMPVMGRIYLNPGFFMEAGFNFGMNLATVRWLERGSNSSNTKSVDEANFFNVDLGAGIGYVFSFGLGLDGRFTYGLTNALENEYFSAGRYAVQFGVSYWFKQR